MTRAGLAAFALLLAACASTSQPVAPVAAPAPQQAERLLVREVGVKVEAEQPAALAARIQQIVAAAGGFVERSRSTDGGELELVARVPVAALDSVVAGIAALGKLEERTESSLDVTEETADLEARLASLVVVRDRLRGLLRDAAGVQDVIAVERELARVQAEIEVLEGRLTRMRTSVALARLTIEVDRRTVLGPLGWVLAGGAWLVQKLFVIR